MERMLSTEEAARRLGVKVPTLYAYVSRGLLASHRDPARRGSLFDLDDIEALAARSRGGRQTATRLATITTGVTQLDQGLGPIYRGRLATELAATASFEEVAELLWQSGDGAGGDWSAPALGPGPPALTQTLDRMRWALVMCGATDALRSDRRPESVARAARRAVAALTDAVGAPSRADPAGASVAARLAGRLAGTGAVVPTEAVNASLVLLADHELATSTVAVRVAASVRSDPYDAFLAGVATLAGPLHGGASQQAYELLALAERDGVPRALDDVLRERGYVPGFGHSVYKSGDPRFGAAAGAGRAAAERGAARHLARGDRTRRGARRPAGQLRSRPGRHELGHRHAARHRAHPLRRGSRGRVGGPLHGGADRTSPALPGPRRLQRVAANG